MSFLEHTCTPQAQGYLWCCVHLVIRFSLTLTHNKWCVKRNFFMHSFSHFFQRKRRRLAIWRSIQTESFLLLSPCPAIKRPRRWVHYIRTTKCKDYSLTELDAISSLSTTWTTSFQISLSCLTLLKWKLPKWRLTHGRWEAGEKRVPAIVLPMEQFSFIISLERCLWSNRGIK